MTTTKASTLFLKSIRILPYNQTRILYYPSYNNNINKNSIIIRGQSSHSHAQDSVASDHAHQNHKSTLHPSAHSIKDRYWLLASVIIFGPLFWYLTESALDTKETVKIVQKSPASSEISSPLVSKPAIATPAPEVPAEPPTVKYVLVGGGTAASSAARAIKEIEPEADVLIITKEDFSPYMRPPLSKELWFEADVTALKFKDWNGKERSLFYQPDHYYTKVDKSLTSLHSPNTEPKKVRLLTQTKVTSLDPDEHFVTLDNGNKIKYSKILIATGGRPKSLEIFDSLPSATKKHIHTYRSIDDFKFLEGLLKSEKDIVIIGGGFLGSELAIALSQKKKNGVKVTQIFSEEGNMGLVFPRYLTKWTSRRLENEGVTVKPSSVIASVTASNDDKVAIDLKSGEHLIADEVVVAVGLHPNTDLAEASALELDDKRGGIMVNAELENRGDVFAAGDVTSYHDIALGRRRVEHHDHAVMSGRTAGENMAGKKKPYTHLSMFWSDLGPEIGYEAVGIIDSSLPTVGVWAKGNDQVRPEEPGQSSPPNDLKPSSGNSIPPLDARPDEEYGKGVVFYLSSEKKKIVGILMWNIFGKVPLARQIIQEKKTYAEINEVATLFNIQDSI